MIDAKRYAEALERGMEAGYRVKSHSDATQYPYSGGGYLAGNVEEKLREAIATAFEIYFDECPPGRWRAHKWRARLPPFGQADRYQDDEDEILQCDRCCTVKGEPGSDICPL